MLIFIIYRKSTGMGSQYGAVVSIIAMHTVGQSVNRLFNCSTMAIDKSAKTGTKLLLPWTKFGIIVHVSYK